jgi:hypothetical protein
MNKKEEEQHMHVLHLLEANRDSPINTTCMACGEDWGHHYGLDCPNGKTKFIHFAGTSATNPNTKFKLRKLLNEKTLSNRSKR